MRSHDEPDEIFESEPADENGLCDSEEVIFLVVVSFLALFLWANFLINGHHPMHNFTNARKHKRIANDNPHAL